MLNYKFFSIKQKVAHKNFVHIYVCIMWTTGGSFKINLSYEMFNVYGNALNGCDSQMEC